MEVVRNHERDDNRFTLEELRNAPYTTGFVGGAHGGWHALDPKGRVSVPHKSSSLTWNDRELPIHGAQFIPFTVRFKNGEKVVFLILSHTRRRRVILPRDVVMYPTVTSDRLGRIALHQPVRDFLGITGNHQNKIVFYGHGPYLLLARIDGNINEVDAAYSEALAKLQQIRIPDKLLDGILDESIAEQVCGVARVNIENVQETVSTAVRDAIAAAVANGITVDLHIKETTSGVHIRITPIVKVA